MLRMCFQELRYDDADFSLCRLAYVMHKTPNVFPIVGGRRIEHLKGNIEALSKCCAVTSRAVS